jgi:hypothetical protein
MASKCEDPEEIFDASDPLFLFYAIYQERKKDLFGSISPTYTQIH